MSHKDIIAKIKKLLSLANSENENEAQIATERANNLLTKYNISMSQIEQDKKYHMEDTCESSRRNYKRELIYSILMKFFFIEVMQTRGYKKVLATFVGEEHNVEIAKYVFEFLDRAFGEGWNNFKKLQAKEGVKVPAKFKHTYYTGFYSGLHKKLQTLRSSIEQEMGLVVVTDPGIYDFLKEENGAKRSKKALSTDAKNGDIYRAGYKDGQETNIAMGLGSDSKEKISSAPLALEGANG